MELAEAVNENAVPPPAAHAHPAQAPAPPQKLKTFEDPAILSMGKRPTPINRPSAQYSATSMERKESARTATGREERVLKDITPAATLVEPFNSVSMERIDSSMTARGRKESSKESTSATLVEPIQKILIADDDTDVIAEGLILDDQAEVSPAHPVEKPKRHRRRKNGRRPEAEFIEPDAAPGKETQRSKRWREGGRRNGEFLEPDVVPAKETQRSKGWRQTPLLEPNPSFQPFTTLKRSKRNGVNDENGWATEDATDVQDMGDFDFAGSLAKFDKKTVFTQIQAEDGVADEDRLVAHNRLPRAKPGTAGGKNLHYTENVLDLPNDTVKVKTDVWKSEAGESELEERVAQRDSGSGRHSRRAESRVTTTRRPPSRKGSSIPQIQPARTLSVSDSRYPYCLIAITDLNQIPAAASNPAFYLVPSDRRCEPISALQMLNLENIADNELGLSEDMMSENAGRGVAEVALSALNAGGRGLTQGKANIIPTVIVFAGNNKSGLRAVAAARHIRNHGMNVVVCVLGLEREAELLVGLKRQLKTFRGFGGKLVTKAELIEYIKTLNAPIELVIDGLLGLTISFEELRTGDQATAYELIEWANRSKVSVLAIDIPTGIDPTTGKVSIIDGRQLYIHAKYVVAMGAPKKGLLEAMALGEGIIDEEGVGKGDEWQLFVADIGLGAAVWKKAGTRVRRGVEFEGSWVVGMRFQGE